MNKPLRETMGLRESVGDIKLGDTVRIKSSGHIGRVAYIGRYGLLDVIGSGSFGVYSPGQVDIIVDKEPSETA